MLKQLRSNVRAIVTGRWEDLEGWLRWMSPTPQQPLSEPDDPLPFKRHGLSRPSKSDPLLRPSDEWLKRPLPVPKKPED